MGIAGRKEAALKLVGRLLSEEELSFVSGADSHGQNGSAYTQCGGDYVQMGNAGPYTQGCQKPVAA